MAKPTVKRRFTRAQIIQILQDSQPLCFPANTIVESPTPLEQAGWEAADEIETLLGELDAANRDKRELEARVIALMYLTPGATTIAQIHEVYQQFKQWRDAQRDEGAL